MGEVLDQSEVDALLAAVGGREIELDVSEGKPAAQVSVYDFKRPERVSKDQIRSLEVLHEVFARNLGASLSGLLRTIVEIRLQAVDQITYSEFIMSLPNPTCFNLLGVAPLEGNMILELNPSIVYPVIDRILGGGRITSAPPERALTEIEWRLIGTIIGRAVEQLKSSWTGVKAIDFRVSQTESNPQLMPIVAPNELVVLISFDIVIGESRGMMNLCIPFLVIEPIIAELTSHSWFGYVRKGAATPQTHEIHANIANAPLQVICYLAETQITVRDLLDLKPGDILETNKPANSPLIMLVEGRPKFFVAPGRYKHKKGARIVGLAPQPRGEARP